MASSVLERHRLNRGFTWRPRTGPFRVIDEAQAKAWNEQGYFVMHDVISRAWIDDLIAEIDPLERETEAFLEEKGGTGRPRWGINVCASREKR